MPIRLLTPYRIIALWALPGLLAAQDMPSAVRVEPHHLRFSPRVRTLEISVENPGKVPGVYRIGTQLLRMREDGGLEEVPSLPHSAVPLLRYAPKAVSLNPGERQIIRLQVRKPDSLEPGEYRCHLTFQNVPPAEADPSSPPTSQGVEVALRTIPTVSIPVEIVHGDLTPQLSLESAALVQGASAQVEAVLVQKGALGLRGFLKLVAINAKDEKTEVASTEVVHYGDLPRQRLRLLLPEGFTQQPQDQLLLVLMDTGARVLQTIRLSRP